MAVIYETVNPTLIANTEMQKIIRDGVHTSYYITPASGYVLHDNVCDFEDYDPETGEFTPKLGYQRGTASCGANYDFVANPREFYAVLESEVPADQIFGGGDKPEHEVM